jgi:thiol-disulfide isomerase/thioredoxin
MLDKAALKTAVARTAAVCLAALAFAACSPAQREQAPSVTPTNPQVTVVDVKRLSGLLAESRGRPVVLNFWATWCPPCVKEMPELARFYAEASARVAFVSVSVDHPDTVEKRVIPFLKEKRIPFPVYVLEEQSPSAVSEGLGLDWQADAVPATFLLDKNGKVRQYWDEEVTAQQLTEAANKIL